MIASQQPNVNKKESIVFAAAESNNKVSSKDNIVFTQVTKQSLSQKNQQTGLNLTKHLAVSYRQNNKNNGSTIYDVYVTGNDRLGKFLAKFLNDHPKLLVKFLNHDYGFNITPKKLR